MARDYWDRYIKEAGGDKELMRSAVGWNSSLIDSPANKTLYNQVIAGQAYDKQQYENFLAPETYDYYMRNPNFDLSVDSSALSRWKAEDAATAKAAQDAQLAAQQAALQKQQQDAEKQKQEQAAALAAQQAALEKQRKETEFKTALDAMNARNAATKQKEDKYNQDVGAMNVKSYGPGVHEEFVGTVNATEDEQKKKKNKRIGYDATKVSGLLGTPNTERKQLLGV